MSKNIWTNIAIQTIVKVGAALLLHKVLAKALADTLERRPDLIDMQNLKKEQ